MTEAVRVQLYRMANSPNVVHTEIEVSSLLCWNTSSFPSEKTRHGQSVCRRSLFSVVCAVVLSCGCRTPIWDVYQRRLSTSFSKMKITKIVLSNSVKMDVLARTNKKCLHISKISPNAHVVCIRQKRQSTLVSSSAFQHLSGSEIRDIYHQALGPSEIIKMHNFWLKSNTSLMRLQSLSPAICGIILRALHRWLIINQEHFFFNTSSYSHHDSENCNWFTSGGKTWRIQSLLLLSVTSQASLLKVSLFVAERSHICLSLALRDVGASLFCHSHSAGGTTSPYRISPPLG